LKTGYGILPRDLLTPVLRLKSNHDFGSNNLAQHVINRLVADGTYDRHVDRLRAAYRAKRDALLSALDEHFSDLPGAEWTRPAGGLYVYLRFPPGIDTGPDSRLLAAALKEGVLYIPGELGHVAGPGRPTPTNEARLSFGVASPAQLREGIRRLRRAVASAGARERSRVPATA
jgi:2-aminoadipate transaminase